MNAGAVANAIETDKPQVILVDMALPDMDGLTLVRKLKADDQTRGIRIVAVTTLPGPVQKKLMHWRLAATPICSNRSAHGICRK